MRSRAQDRRHRCRRAFLSRRSARYGCQEGAAGEPLRPRRQRARSRSDFCSRWRCRKRSGRRGSRRSRAGLARTRSTSVARCSAAIPTARRGRSRSRLPRSARCRTARWCGAPGAKPGDRVVVTGTIGDAALGLLLRRDRPAAAALGPCRRPAGPSRGPLSRAAAAHRHRRRTSAPMRRRPWTSPTALAGDLAKLCRVSGVAAEIEVTRVPLSDAARAALASGARADRDDPHRR